jgi:hypothetical protein
MVFRDHIEGLFDPFEPTNVESALVGRDSTMPERCMEDGEVFSLEDGKVFTLGSLTFGPSAWRKLAPAEVLAYEDMVGLLDPLSTMFEDEGMISVYISHFNF